MQIIGHRGAMGYRPENTISSFELAINQGADAIELDVWLDRNGVPVVFHDETLDALTNGHGPISEKTLDELQGLTVKSPNPNLEIPKGKATIPSLEEVLAFVRGKVWINIELKGPGTAKAVYDLLDSHNKEGNPFES